MHSNFSNILIRATRLSASSFALSAEDSSAVVYHTALYNAMR